MSLRPTARLLRRHPRYFAHLALKKLQFASRYGYVRERGTEAGPRPRPLVYKLMLNWKCNLRCPMCMQWGDVGWVKEAPTQAKDELPWEVVEKIFASGLPRNASFIVSGGEPLLYSRFARLLRLLNEHRRFATVCTNGLLLERYADEIDGNPYGTFLISLDGDQPTNDLLRGKGVYADVIGNIERLQRLRRPPFLAIQFTVMPENVSQMEAFCERMVDLGVDWVLLNPGWFLPESQARHYEEFMRERFDVEPKTHLGYVRKYDYDKDEFRRQLERIRERSWPIRIASYLKEPEWVQDFIDDPEKLLGNRTCYKQWLRIDVLPDGRVAPCVQFPDLTVGDLRTQGLDEVWDGEPNRRFQDTVHSESLPICAKCNNIYLYDGGR
jgi:radical SAM protein with 4Fe4S-binding SPASM domain